MSAIPDAASSKPETGAALVAANQASPYKELSLENGACATGPRCYVLMAWLLDTNVLSELRRPRPEPKVVALISGQPLDQLFISAVVTLAEIRFGIELVTDPNRRSR